MQAEGQADVAAGQGGGQRGEQDGVGAVQTTGKKC